VRYSTEVCSLLGLFGLEIGQQRQRAVWMDDLSPKSSYVLNTTTLYERIFEQRDKISVREEEVGDEKSTS